jgi:hypothetical protein
MHALKVARVCGLTTRFGRRPARFSAPYWPRLNTAVRRHMRRCASSCQLPDARLYALAGPPRRLQVYERR